MNTKYSDKLELNKILSDCSSFAVLENTKRALSSFEPKTDLKEVRALLSATSECDKLLFRYGVGKIEYFVDSSVEITRASKGAALTCGELLKVNALLRSARIAFAEIDGAEEELPAMKSLASRLYFDEMLEDDISEKILADNQIADCASETLFSIRSKIRSLNERIRSTLAEYASGKDSRYLQDSIVTIRNDRYVIPVKAEYKSKVKGFVHDRSQSGSTFFIEPEYVLNLNNELIALGIDEKEEEGRILKALSVRVGAMRDKLLTDAAVLEEIDSFYARAEYSYSVKAVCPEVNKKGVVNIIKGRHPLIAKDKVVPVSVELGREYSFLLLSGANTGGKTVTLKMVGLFCLMAECGLFIPAAVGSSVCAFDKVFCDLGDSQSIEESLSTFSGHVANVVSVCDGADENSLVLIDELGGGTDPDEGQALARAVLEYLLKVGCKGIVTTHFTALKEFACGADGVENAAMEFDSATLRPLYSIKIGLPGASNALAISRRLGMKEEILTAAESYLSDGGRNYENILRGAEENNLAARAKFEEAEALREEWKKKTEEAKSLLSSIEREREKLGANARAESRRMINERVARAEELLEQLEAIFSREEISETDLIEARTLRNKIRDESYEKGETPVTAENFTEATAHNVVAGACVFVKTLQSRGEVLSFNPAKGEAEVACGSIKIRVKLKDILFIEKSAGGKRGGADNVKVVRKFTPRQPSFEINVIGMNSEEALYEVENFIDKAVTDNLERIKIIHGVGTGKLRSAIQERLKRHPHVKEYRSGRYGEGEIGVTIVTLK